MKNKNSFFSELKTDTLCIVITFLYLYSRQIRNGLDGFPKNIRWQLLYRTSQLTCMNDFFSLVATCLLISTNYCCI